MAAVRVSIVSLSAAVTEPRRSDTGLGRQHHWLVAADTAVGDGTKPRGAALIHASWQRGLARRARRTGRGLEQVVRGAALLCDCRPADAQKAAAHPRFH
jgi:hypothetical protein